MVFKFTDNFKRRMGLNTSDAVFSRSREKGVRGGSRYSVIKRIRVAFINVGSFKLKILLALCIVFALFLIATPTGFLMGWRYDRSLQNMSLNSRLRYAVLINTWRRNSLLKQAISHYASCSSIDSIHVVWSEDNQPSETLKSYLWKTLYSKSSSNYRPELTFDINEDGNLNNRFKPIEGLRTDAVFSVDDDVIIPCPTLEFAFSVWQSASESMVGFVPRMHWLDAKRFSALHYKYGGWWSVWWMGTYSMVLSKAAFFHKKYLEMYTYRMPTSVQEYVNRERYCEDIAMSFLVANATGAPPIWVKGKVFEIGSSGISSLNGHSQQRNKCLNDFVTLYGYMPLVPSNMKAVNAQYEWFW